VQHRYLIAAGQPLPCRSIKIKRSALAPKPMVYKTDVRRV
jgi:hypothetical protein